MKKWIDSPHISGSLPVEGRVQEFIDGEKTVDFLPRSGREGFQERTDRWKKRLIFPHISGREGNRIDRWRKGRFSANARGRVFVFFNLREREL